MPLGVLDIIRRAAPKLGIDQPESVFGSTDRTAIELASIVGEVAERIARAHDWTRLTTQAELIGDGIATSLALPADFLRMTRGGNVWSSDAQQPLVAVPLTEDWLQLQVRGFDVTPGSWRLAGDAIEVMPAPAAGETLKLYYISSNFAKAADGTAKGGFTAGTDTFLLGDRLLELTLIWEWRSRKGLPYGEDMVTAETALAQAISDDKGPRVLTQRSRSRLDAQPAYPWSIEP